MTRNHKQTLIMALLAGITIVALGASALVMMPAGDASAQGLRTPGALQTTIAQTAQAVIPALQEGEPGALQTEVAATVEAITGNVQATVGAASGSVQATIGAASENLYATRDAVLTNLASYTPGAVVTQVVSELDAVRPQLEATAYAIQTQAAGFDYQDSAIYATAEALVTAAYADIESIQATAAAVATQFANYEDWAELTAEQLAMLESLLTNGSITFDEATNTFTIATTYSETALNAAIDASLLAIGYDPAATSLDLIPGGYILTVEGISFSEQLTGTLEVVVAMAAENGRVAWVIVQAAVNGFPLNDAMLDLLMAQLGAADLNGTLLALMMNELVLATTAVDAAASYYVQNLVTTGTDLSMSVLVTAGAAPTPTPAP